MRYLKITFSLLLVFLLYSPVDAATGAPLKPVWNTAVTSPMNGSAAMTDGNTSTFYDLYGNGTVYYKFLQPITGATTMDIYMKANGSVASGTLSITKSDGTSVSTNFSVSGTTPTLKTFSVPMNAVTFSIRSTSGNYNYWALHVNEITYYEPPDTIPPNNVSNLSVSNITFNSASLAWTNPSDSDLYKIEVYNGTTFLGSVFSTSHSIDLSGLLSDTTYNLTVKAIDTSGNPSTGTPITFKTLPVPDKPKDLTITGTAASQTEINLSFSAQFTNTIYLYRNGTLLNTLGGSVTSYKDTGLNTSTTYEYYIVGENPYGTAASNIITVKTLDPPPPPTGLTISSGTVLHNRVSVQFQATDASSIKLYRDGTVVANLSGSATTYTDSSVQPETQYKYWITATNSGGTSASNIIDITTPKIPPPSGVSIQGTAAKDKVNLSFQATNASSIKVYKDGVLVVALSGTATGYTDTNVTQNTTYKYWIVASNGSGDTASSIITIKPLAPGQIKNLQVTEKTRSYAKFKWDVEPTAEKYIIDILITHEQTASIEAASSPPPSTSTTLETLSTDLTVNNLSVGDQVKVSVSAYNQSFGKHGTASVSLLVPVVEVPTFPQRPTAISPADVVESGASLATSFWPFVLLGLTFIVAGWIIGLKTKAVKAPSPSTNNPKRGARELKRTIRMDLRKE